MRDGINLARRGTPAVALVTEEFEPQAAFVARAAGMESAPRVVLPHPIAGAGAERHREVAGEFAGRILEALAGGGPSAARST